MFLTLMRRGNAIEVEAQASEIAREPMLTS
jgi:hypothetical protein